MDMDRKLNHPQPGKAQRVKAQAAIETKLRGKKAMISSCYTQTQFERDIRCMNEIESHFGRELAMEARRIIFVRVKAHWTKLDFENAIEEIVPLGILPLEAGLWSANLFVLSKSL